MLSISTDKIKVLNRIHKNGIVAVIRAESPEKALKITEAVKAGGIDAIEITMTVPGAIDVIKELSETYNKEEILLGAGSVLDSETANSCIQAGAQYIVGPALDRNMVKTCNRYEIPVIPGAMTPTEVKKAMEYGADIVKVFPASLFGPKIVSSIKGPLPHANLLPTGGVNLENVQDWIKAGSYAVAAGSAICGGAKSGDYELVTKKSRKFIEKIKKARQEK